MRMLFETDLTADAIEAVHIATAIYTRDPIVNQLLDELAWPDGHGKLAETSCGDGAFLVAAIHRLVSHGIDSWEDIPRRVEGWEFHPGAAAAAKERVVETMTALGFCRDDARRCALAVVKNSDFLTEGPPEDTRYSAIVGNPPFMRMATVPPVPSRHPVSPGHKLTGRASSPGATTVHLVPRAPRWDMCPGGLATTNAQ